MKRNYDMALLESMILSNKIRLTEATCVFPDGWNQELGDKFRTWFLKTHPDKAKQLNLDPTGPYDNSTMLNAYCYNPYGLETAGDRFMMLDSDEGGGAPDDWDFLEISPIGWLSIGIGCMVILGIGWLKYRKIKAGVRIAKEVAKQSKNYPGGKAQMLEDTLDTLKDKSKRSSFLNKFLKSKSLTQEERKAAEAALENPGVISAEQKLIQGMLYQEFKNGNISASELIRITKMNPTSQEAQMLKAIDKARKKTGKRNAWPSKDNLKKMRDRLKSNASKSKEKSKLFKPVTSNPKLSYMAVGDDVANTWFIFKGNVSKDSIDIAYRRALNNANLSFKEATVIKSGPGPSSLFKELNGNGKRLLAKHANAEKFPTLNQWTIEMNRAGASPQVSPGDISRYIKNLALWHLVNKPI